MRSEEDHLRIRELLPWYANGTLGAAEAARVKAHLAGCLTCRQELARCREMSTGLKSRDEDVWRPSPTHWAQVLETVEAAEARPAARWRNRIETLRSWLIGTPRPVRWALALQTTLIALLSLAVLLPAPQHFETLSRDERSTEPGVALRIVFTEDITERELRELLHGAQASIVQGPSPLGVYTIELAPAGQDRGAAVLASLRSHPKVRLAEFVDAGSRR